jgi:hypothetical protein
MFVGKSRKWMMKDIKKIIGIGYWLVCNEKCNKENPKNCGEYSGNMR